MTGATGTLLRFDRNSLLFIIFYCEIPGYDRFLAIGLTAYTERRTSQATRQQTSVQVTKYREGTKLTYLDIHIDDKTHEMSTIIPNHKRFTMSSFAFVNHLPLIIAFCAYFIHPAIFPSNPSQPLCII